MTGVLHWWVAASLQWSATLLDGGDQVAMNLTLLLVPVTLLDGRIWHWDPPAGSVATRVGLAKRLVALTAFAAIRVQVMLIYYTAGVAKYSVEEWADGTALYYWLRHPVFGASAAVRPIVESVILSPVLLPLATWGVLVLEGLLAAALFIHPRHRPKLFWFAALFHLGIALLHGILTFAIAMEAALILYLLPVSRTLEELTARARKWARLRKDLLVVWPFREGLR